MSSEKKEDSEALKKIKELAKEENDFYDKYGYFSWWSDALKVQKIIQIYEEGFIAGKDSGGYFICGNCRKKFKAYHDGKGWNTGFCPDCLTKHDTVGLESKPKSICPKCNKHYLFHTGSEGHWICPDELKGDDRLCLGCSEKFEGGVHAYMCGTCTHKLLNEDGIIVKRVDLLRWALKLYEAINDQEFIIDEFEELMNEIEAYGIE